MTHPENEPILGYAPGSPERAALQEELSRQSSEVVEIPCIINGEPVFTGDTTTQVMPHDHGHVLATVHLAGEAEVRAACEAAVAAQESWIAMGLDARSQIFLRAADLLAGDWRMRVNAATMLNQSKTAFQAEIDAACELIDFWRFNVHYASEFHDQLQPLVSPEGFVNTTEIRPLEGFVLAITPFNFTSIAGTGPIVGPAIAVIWGWLPALLWVVLGSIFIGAVHDFGALVVSLRNNGQTVGDIAGRVLNKRVRLLFLFVLFMALTVVLAIFGLVIAAVFKQYPAAIFPCVVQIPIAVTIGMLLHRKGVGLLVPSLVALGVMYLSVVFGNGGALGSFNAALAAWPIWQWVVVLLVYSYIASDRKSVV